jgi:uncharacterized membrane protein
MEFIALLLTALLFIVIDFVWFQYSLPRFYGPTFKAIQGHDMQLRLGGGLFAWLLLAYGIKHFVHPFAKDGKSAFIQGAILGFVVYGVYNGTNYATFSEYPIETFIADNLWGTFVTGAVSYLSFVYL